MKCPCHKCTKRSPECHTYCKDYNEWCLIHKKEKEAADIDYYMISKAVYMKEYAIKRNRKT